MRRTILIAAAVLSLAACTNVRSLGRWDEDQGRHTHVSQDMAHQPADGTFVLNAMSACNFCVGRGALDRDNSVRRADAIAGTLCPSGKAERVSESSFEFTHSFRYSCKP